MRERHLLQTLLRWLAPAATAGMFLVLVTGSIFLVGAVRALLLGLPRDPPVAL